MTPSCNFPFAHQILLADEFQLLLLLPPAWRQRQARTLHRCAQGSACKISRSFNTSPAGNESSHRAGQNSQAQQQAAMQAHLHITTSTWTQQRTRYCLRMSSSSFSFSRSSLCRLRSASRRIASARRISSCKHISSQQQKSHPSQQSTPAVVAEQAHMPHHAAPHPASK
jgi:hypothetical protein